MENMAEPEDLLDDDLMEPAEPAQRHQKVRPPKQAAARTTATSTPQQGEQLSAEDVSRIVEMGWEDRTPFEAIEMQFGLSEPQVIALMRATMTKSSFKMWRTRTHGRSTKHKSLAAQGVNRHQAQGHNKFR
jgi:uncharacterized protein (TIGR03643 family)